jgi:hypothetical protein
LNVARSTQSVFLKYCASPSKNARRSEVFHNVIYSGILTKGANRDTAMNKK